MSTTAKTASLGPTTPRDMKQLPESYLNLVAGTAALAAWEPSPNIWEGEVRQQNSSWQQGQEALPPCNTLDGDAGLVDVTNKPQAPVAATKTQMKQRRSADWMQHTLLQPTMPGCNEQ